MGDKPLEYVAGYVSPLTDKEHAQLGRIAVLWGQIENFVDELLEHVSGLSWNELEGLGVTTKPMATKASFLNQVRHRHEDAATAEKIGDFCALIHETKAARNDAFHGMWGSMATTELRLSGSWLGAIPTPKHASRSASYPRLRRSFASALAWGWDRGR